MHRGQRDEAARQRTELAPKRLRNLLQLQRDRGAGPMRQVELARALGVSRRAIRSAANALRKEGVPICSGNSGYWMAKDHAELTAVIARMESEAHDMLVVAAALRRTKHAMLNPAAPQAELWEAPA